MKSLQSITTACGLLLVWCCAAVAQQGVGISSSQGITPPSASSTAAGSSSTVTASPLAVAGESAAPNVEESRPAIYFLPDKQGKLQPVLDFSYQDFVDLYKLKNQFGRREQPPVYSIQRISATGTAKETHAELSVQFQIIVRDDDWVRVPLRLNQALLRGAAEYRGDGKQFVNYEGEEAGYVCWIRGKANTQHEITLSMLMPLESAGDATRLNLYVPRATASELKLTVPIANAVGAVSEGATLLPAMFKDAATDFAAAGLVGNFQLAWHKPNTAADAAVVLDAVGTVLVKLDGRSISTEAVLSVHSHGAAFDRVTVRLPPETDFVSGRSDGATITPLDANGKSGKSNGQRSVEVRFSKKIVGPIDIQLSGRRAYDPIKNQAWCELAGFEVVGAARQWGTLAVAAGGEWQSLWGASRETRQIDQLPEALRKEDTIAGFEYSSQPYSLPIRLTPRKTRVNVEPEYVLSVERNQMRLEGKLKYTIRGAKVSTLEIAIPGWELDEAGPDELVAAANVVVESNVAFVPLDRATSGTAELQLRAHRTISADAKSLSIRLPHPQGCSVGPASLAVTAADNVELTPNAQAIEGLVRQRTPPPMKLPARQQDPLFYRGLGGDAVFSADFRTHAGRITAEAASRVHITGRTAAVEQKFSYTIAYEPTDQLTVSIPHLAAKQIKAKLSGSSTSLVVSAPKPAGDTVAGMSTVIALPEPRIGNCEVTLTYSVPLAEPTADSPTSVSVPLAMPEDGELLSNTAAVNTVKSIRVSPQKGLWNPSHSDTADSADLLLAAPTRTDSLELHLQRTESENGGAIVVDRAWVQSWLTPIARQDRAVFQFDTDRKDLEMILPAGVIVSLATALVDGRPVTPQPLADRRILIPLGGRRNDGHCTVELQYHFSDSRPPRGAMDFAFPQIQSGAWMRRMVWQLILPANEHLLASPDGFTSESVWRWHAWHWDRTPAINQTQLETWVGARPSEMLPSGMNVYLFSAIGNVKYASVHTASRTWLVLWASGAALAVGLLLIYFPRLRHPVILLMAGAALAAAGWISPEPALLFAQAAVAGLTLAILAWLLTIAVPARVVRQEISHSFPRIDAATPHTVFVSPSAGGNLAPTEVVPNNPSPSKGEQGTMSVFARASIPLTAIILTAALLVCLSIAVGGETEHSPDGAIRFHRVLAPEDRMKDWPIGGEKYIPIDSDEFDHMTSAMKPRTLSASAAPLTAISASHYDAKLVGEHLLGRGTLDVVAAGSRPTLLPFDACNLAIREVVWDGSTDRHAKSNRVALGIEQRWPLGRRRRAFPAA